MPYSGPKLPDFYTLSKFKLLENCALYSSTYLYRLYMGVTPHGFQLTVGQWSDKCQPSAEWWPTVTWLIYLPIRCHLTVSQQQIDSQLTIDCLRRQLTVGHLTFQLVNCQLAIHQQSAITQQLAVCWLQVCVTVSHLPNDGWPTFCHFLPTNRQVQLASQTLLFMINSQLSPKSYPCADSDYQ